MTTDANEGLKTALAACSKLGAVRGWPLGGAAMNDDPPQGGARRQVGRSGVSEIGKERLSNTQRLEILKEHERGMTVAQVCRRYGISPTTFYRWRAKFVDPILREAPSREDERIALADENRRLKKLLGQQVLDNSILKEMLAKKGK